MKLTGLFYAIILCVALGLSATVRTVQAQRKNVILYIGDGFGIAPKVAARMALGQGRDTKRFSSDPNFHLMQLDALRYVAPITTHSLNSWITDSAPGAACYASGKAGKIDNEFISVDPVTLRALPTILEAAKKSGYAVGLVTTTRITHATPAVFGSHVWERDLEDYIAAQYISASEQDYESVFNSSDSSYNANRDWQLPAPKVGVEIDVLLGGGARHFLPKKNGGGANTVVRDRNGYALTKTPGGTDTIRLGSGKRVDNADLVELAKQRGYVYVNSRDALLGVDLNQFTPGGNKKLLGLFRDSHCDYEQDRQMKYGWQPMLAEMTQLAIEVLKRKSPKGFFLVVEGGRIDHLEHANCGGIGFTPDRKNYIVNSDNPAYAEDMVYTGDTTAIVKGMYGSDYMIKEVLAYDYSIGKGRALLNDPTDQTLILATSDHECGGFAVVGLHDELDAQGNGSKVRTYAKVPSKSVFTPPPVNISRGDANINGWYPDYSMVDFQGYQWPKADSNGRRIVVAYGSNPQTNGNGSAKGGTPGNHTPQDVLAYADDNVGGAFASRLAGRGLLDNTDLEPMMEDFLGVRLGGTVRDDGPAGAARGSIIPNPVQGGGPATVEFTLDKMSAVTVEVYNSLGQRVRTLRRNIRMSSGPQSLTWTASDDSNNPLPPDAYMIMIKADGTATSQKLLVK